MGEAEKKDYVIPCRIGDQIFEVYAGMVFPAVVSGFYISSGEIYVIAEEPEAALEHHLHLSNLYLSEEAGRAAGIKN